MDTLFSGSVFKVQKIENLFSSLTVIFSKYDLSELQGLIIAFSIMSIWLISTFYFFQAPIIEMHVLIIGVAVLWQTFLYTGLFITAHDAMHGVIFQKDFRVNDFIGSLAVLLYGFFSYRHLLNKHWLHHRYPATKQDPDYHNGTHRNFLAWYLQFMRNYWSWSQMVSSIVAFYCLYCFMHISQVNLTLFWIIPSLLSSIQLFFFGTFLTHRQPEEGYSNVHHAETIALPVWLSFITCYHFSYHLEHHRYPFAPWWQLPSIHEKSLKGNSSFI